MRGNTTILNPTNNLLQVSGGIITITADQVLFADGSAAFPSIAFSSDDDTGIYRNTTNGMVLVAGQTGQLAISGSGVTVLNGQGFSWSAGGAASGADIFLRRDAANTLALRNGDAVQYYRVYGATTSNAFLQLSHDMAVARITTSGGTIFLGTSTGAVGRIYADYTDFSVADTGNKTIDKMMGSVNIAAGQTSIVVTNSLVTASSKIMTMVGTASTNCLVKNVVPGAGSFTITTSGAVSAESRINFVVFNAN